MLQLPPLPSGIRLLTDDELARLRKADPSLPRTPKDCETCEGTGTFRWWDPDRKEIVDWECNCTDQWMARMYLAYCGIGKLYAHLSWNDLTNLPPGHEAVVAAQEYIRDAHSRVRTGLGLVFWGRPGTGKTAVGSLMLKALLAAGHEAHFIRFADAIDLFMSAWRDPDEKQWFYQRIRNTGVLVVDDIGREAGGRITQASETVEEVLRHRIANARPTIFTSNLDPVQMGERYGIVSLLLGYCTTVQFTNESFLAQNADRTLSESQQGLSRPIVFG